MIHLVVIPNGMILAAYETLRHAELHTRTILGARTLSVPLLSELPPEVRDDIESDDWDEDDDTAVQDSAKTDPGTPRSKAASKPPETT